MPQPLSTESLATPLPGTVDSGARMMASPARKLRRTTTLGRQLDFVHLFSGPEHRADGLAAALGVSGHRCWEYDIVNGDHQNLADEEVWTSVLQKLTSCSGAVCGPPCSTFSRARRNRPGEQRGPRPVRGPTGADRYGLPGLTPAEKEQVRIGTLLGLRALEAAQLLHGRGAPWVVEQPLAKEGEISLFNLDEWLEFRGRPGVKQRDIVQCVLGAQTSKPTTLLYGNCSLEDWVDACPHPARRWRCPLTGSLHVAPHPPLRGKVWYVKEEDWVPGRHRVVVDRDLPFLTSAAQAYPAQMNRALAEALLAGIPATTKVTGGPQPAASSGGTPRYERRGQWSNVLVRMEEPAEGEFNVAPEIHFQHRLRPHRGPATMPSEAPEAVGGLRSAQATLRRLPVVQQYGRELRPQLERFLDKNAEGIRGLLEDLGAEDFSASTYSLVEDFRRHLAGLLDCDRYDGVSGDLYDTDLRPGLFSAWVQRACDPDVHIPHWLEEGAPAGIASQIPTAGIFPTDASPPDEQESLSLLGLEDFTNYRSVDGDPEAIPLVEGLAGTGFFSIFEDAKECRAWLHARPVFSRMAMLCKTRKDGTVKRRLISDCRRSGVNSRAKLPERLVLPRVADAVRSALHLLQQRRPDSEIEMMAIDFKDAFWQVPLRHEERPFFATVFQKRIFVYRRLAQGSKSAPLIWGRTAALTARLTASLFSDKELQLLVYVDDPLVLVSGTRQQRDRCFALTLLVWMALGFKLAAAKASRGADLSWIGAHLTLNREEITVTLKPELLEELRDLVVDMLKHNTVSRRAVRTLAGKAAHMASLVFTWRPFLDTLWAALCTEDSPQPGLLWTKQITPALTWLLAFISHTTGSVCRTYRLEHFLGLGVAVVITFDASPWGLGAVLKQGDTITHYISCPLTKEDADHFGHPLGDPRGQQTWEALALLVAMRSWADIWQRSRVHLTAKGDSVSALSLLTNLKSRGAGSNAIARELALDLGAVAFAPRLVQHIAGTVPMSSPL